MHICPTFFIYKKLWENKKKFKKRKNVTRIKKVEKRFYIYEECRYSLALSANAFVVSEHAI